VRGRGGRTLREAWDDDDGRAYLGTAVPGFPNLFILYGPNLQAGHGGSLMFFLEAQMHYVMGLLRRMVADGLGALDLRPEVCAEYNARLEALHESMIWTHPGMATYYRNSKGRVVVPTPLRVIDFWALTRRAALEDYGVEPAPA
jgi:4-hydroxyacetophenone monooxygenase